ncbi:MAG TPA: PKD domain-containing protein [Flavobacteriales bacterium]|nr:PKD domain-containing protein [Flavobacteriales bacterium]
MASRLLLVCPFLLFWLTSTAQPGPFYYADLPFAPAVCSDTSFSTDATQNGIGAQVDLNASNQGCLATGERQGFWIAFHMQTAGVVGFTVQPNADADYDLGVWGPFEQVPSALTTQPLRCSYAAVVGATGLSSGFLDLNEASSGDGWVRSIDALAEEWYVVFINNFSMNGVAFSLTWDLQNGATLQCQDRPEPAFEQSSAMVDAGGTVSFTQQSTNDPYAWWWVFEGGSPAESFAPDPQDISYPLPGCYDVTLTAYNAAGDNTLVTSCQVMVETSTAIESPDAQGFVITPDDDGLGIVPNVEGRYSLRLIDGLGRTVLVLSAQGTLEVPLRELRRGVYSVVVEHASGRTVKRMLLGR